MVIQRLILKLTWLDLEMPRGCSPAVESVDKIGSRWKLKCTHRSIRHYRPRWGLIWPRVKPTCMGSSSIPCAQWSCRRRLELTLGRSDTRIRLEADFSPKYQPRRENTPLCCSLAFSWALTTDSRCAGLSIETKTIRKSKITRLPPKLLIPK